MKHRVCSIVISVTGLLITGSAFAAVGCTLRDPDRDVRRLFPAASNYKTDFFSFEENGHPGLRQEVEAKLGDVLDEVYETDDVPYAYYTVLQGKEVIGYVHGVNQKGRFGGMQLILATDTEGTILDFYYQKLSSPEAKKFRNKKFTGQFVGLTLKDFYTVDLAEKIADPSEKNEKDYKATLRGLKKNLILYDYFILNNKYDKFFEGKQDTESEHKTKHSGDKKS
jgi:hypothetical protein